MADARHFTGRLSAVMSHKKQGWNQFARAQTEVKLAGHSNDHITLYLVLINTQKNIPKITRHGCFVWFDKTKL